MGGQLGDIIEPFVVMDVMNRAAELERRGRRVLHLEVGQPSSGAPATALAAGHHAMLSDKLGYSSAVGMLVLREAIAEHYQRRMGMAVDPDRIVATPGSSGGFVLAFLASLPAGASVAIAEPGYPCYRNILLSLGFRPVTVPCRVEDGYQLTVDGLREHAEDVAGLLIASPANPTGSIIGKLQLDRLTAYCRERGIVVISDEIYQGIDFGEAAVTVLTSDPDAIVVNSFSKYFSMTGWRIGWLVVPAPLVRTVEKLSQNLFIAPSTLSQYAAASAFAAEDELQSHIARYAANRSLVLAGLQEAGFARYAPPQGAFYVYAEAGHLTSDSSSFCRRLLEEEGVAITPGTDFDKKNGSRTIRFSYSGATEDILDAMQRFRAFAATYRD